jgi:hypothetical protein
MTNVTVPSSPLPSNGVAPALLFHAVSSGELALDQGEGGGNPFASALIETLARPQARLGELPDALRTLTEVKSAGYMTADVPAAVTPVDWPLVSRGAENRKALVLVISDYEKAGLTSLAGAAYDAGRIATALTEAGFATKAVLDLDRAGIEDELIAFGAESRSADAAVIYTTGHGVEVDGRVYLLPADYPAQQGNAALATCAMPLREIAASIQARAVNLVFYGGCREDSSAAACP